MKAAFLCAVSVLCAAAVVVYAAPAELSEGVEQVMHAFCFSISFTFLLAEWALSFVRILC